MNVLYDFFLTPQPKDSNKTRYHARLVVRDTITLEDIAETIESRSSLRQSDVIGSFIAVSYSLQWNRFYSGKRFASRIKGYNF